MPLSSRVVVSTLVLILYVPAPVQAQDNDDQQRGTAQRSPDAIVTVIEPRAKQMICVSHLEVTEEGAHLRRGQVLVMAGPLFDNSYFVMPVHPGTGGVEDLKWAASPLSAKRARFGDGIYVIDKVTVTEPGGEHPDPDEHPIIVQVSETDDDGCPTEVDIHGFEHRGVKGQHGGRAHASGGGG